MAYQKFRADQLFDGYRFLDRQKVLVTSEDGTVEEIIGIKDAGDDVQEFSGILTPGFINCHCHLELSHMRGNVSEGTGLLPFVAKVIRDRHAPEEQIWAAIQEGEDQMLAEGIVAVGDVCNNKLTVTQKSGQRLLYHNFIEASGITPGLAGSRFERAVDIYHAYSVLYDEPAASNSIVPHAPYSVSDELWEKIAGFGSNRILTMHNQEIAAENELFLNGSGAFLDFYRQLNMDVSGFRASGRSSLQTWLPRFRGDQNLILVHNIYTSAEDLFLWSTSAASPRTYWCFCPNANLYIGGVLPDLPLFIQQGVTIVLGTDSLASNHRLSMLAEMKTLRDRFPFVKLENLLSWATINGASALQLDDRLGSFEKGKKPGVVLCEATLTGSRRLL
jgi:cytosine/adenosine deaminase-related metal-dependent hydrolase